MCVVNVILSKMAEDVIFCIFVFFTHKKSILIASQN